MLTETLYPAFISLRNKNFLVCGFGAVGKRKAAALLAAEASRILVLDINANAFLPQDSSKIDERMVCENRACTEEDVRNSFMVFAATNDREENRRIAALCHKHSILCNCASDPENSSFIVPAVARFHGVALALSTGCASPMLARKWRAELEMWLKDKAQMAWLLGKLRPIILGNDSAANEQKFKKIDQSDIGNWLAQRDMDACANWFAENLPEISQDDIRRILAEFEIVFTR